MKKIKPIDLLILIGGICGIALAIERIVHEKWMGALLFGVMGAGNLYIVANRFAAQKKLSQSVKQ